MKKILIVLMCVAALALSASSALAESKNAEIIYTKGEVKMQGQGDISWITAEEGMLVTDGDKIKTSKSSAAEIALDEDADNVIRIEEQTEFKLEDKIDKRAELLSGEILALMDALEPGSSFEVRTPTAVCGVTASGMFVKTDGSSTTAGCHEHGAYTKGINKDGSLTSGAKIKQGHKCIIYKFKSPGPLAPLSGKEKGKWLAFKKGLMGRKGKSKSKGSSSRKVIDRMKKLQERIDKRTEIQREDRLEKETKENRDSSSGSGEITYGKTEG